MSPVVIKSIGTGVAGVLAALAVSNTFPQYSPLFKAVADFMGGNNAALGLVFGSAASLITGWLHIKQPEKKVSQ